jgi:hypothetical protein
MVEIQIGNKITLVNEKLAEALVKMGKAVYTKEVEAEEKPKRTYKTKVLKAEDE